VNSFVEKFKDEVNEYCERLESGLLLLEHEPENHQIIDEIFRIMHSMKGSGGMFGFELISEVTHNMESLYVAAPIDEIDAAQIRPGMEARITLDALPKKVFKGQTRSVSPYVLEHAKQARTVEIEVDFQETVKDVNLLVGYSADVEIIVEGRSKVVRIATESLQKDGHIYVVDPKNNRLQYRKATSGLSNWQFTEIREGLAAGERVVTTIDRQGLADGVAVVIEAQEPGKVFGK